MKDLFFVIKVFVFSIVLIVALQVQHEGETLEARAETYFASSKPVDWLKEQGSLIKKTFTKVSTVAKSKLRQQLKEPAPVAQTIPAEYGDVNPETINREPGIIIEETSKQNGASETVKESSENL